MEPKGAWIASRPCRALLYWLGGGRRFCMLDDCFCLLSFPAIAVGRLYNALLRRKWGAAAGARGMRRDTNVASQRTTIRTSTYCYMLPGSTRPVYYMFVDESGTPRISGDAARGDVAYIQCGLIVHEDNVHRARAAVDRAKRELSKGIDTMKWELHGYEIWRSKGKFAAGLRIPDSEKNSVFVRAVKALEESECVLVCVIIWKDRLPPGQHNLLKISWRLIVERFEQYLADRGGDCGSIIADASGRGTEAKIRSLLQDVYVWQGRRRIHPVLTSTDVRFVDSLDEPLVQAADVAAYIVQKHCRGDDSFRGLFDALVTRVWQCDGKADGFGIKHYPDHG